MPAALSSTGEQKALLLSPILANAWALMAEAGPVLDEVGASDAEPPRRALRRDRGAWRAQAFPPAPAPSCSGFRAWTVPAKAGPVAGLRRGDIPPDWWIGAAKPRTWNGAARPR